VLNHSPKTVEFHKYRIMHLLNPRTVADLAVAPRAAEWRSERCEEYGGAWPRIPGLLRMDAARFVPG